MDGEAVVVKPSSGSNSIASWYSYYASESRKRGHIISKPFWNDSSKHPFIWAFTFEVKKALTAKEFRAGSDDIMRSERFFGTTPSPSRCNLDFRTNRGIRMGGVKRLRGFKVSKRIWWVEVPPRKTFCNLLITTSFWWWRNPESNWGHKDFQSSALPTELFRQVIDY